MIEVGLKPREDSQNLWVAAIYNQKYGGVVLEREQEFASKDEARCWFETVATLDKEYEHSFYGHISTNQDIEYAEKLMNFKYADIA